MVQARQPREDAEREHIGGVPRAAMRDGEDRVEQPNEMLRLPERRSIAVVVVL